MSVKTAKRRPGVADTQKIPTQRVNLQLSVDAYKRLGIHCTMEGTSPGEEVTRLINEYLRAWTMPSENRRKTSAGPVATEDRLEAADDVNPPALATA